MPKQTILVCMNEVDRVEQMISAVKTLNSKLDAHFIGIYVIPAIQIFSEPGMMYSAQVNDGFRLYFQNHAKDVKKKFNNAAKTTGMSAEWREIDSDLPFIADSVIKHARMCDMVIVPQSHGTTHTNLADDFTEQVVMDCGRPVLVIPDVGEIGDFGNQVMLAWDASKESTRAVFDSLPLLEAAKQVHLSWLDEGETRSDMDLPGAELATVLSRRGIKVTTENLPESDLLTGDALLSHARELSADLLVMGAYGHSRLRETVFGGATRTLLKDMPVPVLMSN